MQKIKILHCLFTLRYAGAESFIMNVLRELDADKYQFDFLIRCRHEDAELDLMREIRKRGGQIIETAEFPRYFIRNYRQLDYFLKKNAHKYAAIHIHANSLLYLAPLLLARKYGIQTRILHSHNSGSVNGMYTMVHLVNRSILSKAATCRLACSDVAGRWMFKQDYELVKNGIDLSIYCFNQEVREAERKRLGVTGSCTVIGNIGRFAKQKNHRMMIRVFEQYHQRNPDSILVLAGAGEQETEIKKLAGEKGLEKSIIFPGLRKDAYRLYQSFDIFLMPSFYEGLPFTLIEAQAAGLPCVVSDRISQQAVLSDHVVTCNLSDNVSCWADAVAGCTMQFAGRTDVVDIVRKSGFDIRKTVSQMEKIYTRSL